MNQPADISFDPDRPGTLRVVGPRSVPPAGDPGDVMAAAFQAAVDDLAATLNAAAGKPAAKPRYRRAYGRQAAAIAAVGLLLGLLIAAVGWWYRSAQLSDNAVATGASQPAANTARPETTMPTLGAAADAGPAAAPLYAALAPAAPSAAGSPAPGNAASAVGAVPVTAAKPGAEAVSEAETPTRFRANIGRNIPPAPEMIVTPFAAYDAGVVAAVRERWLDLLGTGRFQPPPGKAVIEFRLSNEGRVSGLKVRENDSDAVLALVSERAIRDPVPYPRWPEDMRRAMPQEYRDMTFTFDYQGTGP